MTVCLSSDFTEVLLLELLARDRSGLLRRLDYGCKHLTQILLGTEFLLLLFFSCIFVVREVTCYRSTCICPMLTLTLSL